MPKTLNTQIAIEGIRVHAYHGVYARERKEGHTFVVDVFMEVAESKAGNTDQLEDTIDYSVVYEWVLTVMENPVNLLETLAKHIGEGLLSRYEQMVEVRVRVSKISPMTMDFCQRTYVETTIHA